MPKRFVIRNAVLALLFVNIAMFILQIVLSGVGFTELLLLRKGDLFTRPWTLLTSMFLHGGFSHILFNMFVLMMFGPLLEQRIGTRRFLGLYFGSGLLAAAVSSFVYESALGASGAIMGLLGMIIVLMPYLRVLFFFIIPMPMWIAGIVIALIDILGVFYPGGIANIAHLVGMATGLVYGLRLKGKRKSYNRRFSRSTQMSSEDVEDYLRHGRI